MVSLKLDQFIQYLRKSLYTVYTKIIHSYYDEW